MCLLLTHQRQSVFLVIDVRTAKNACSAVVWCAWCVEALLGITQPREIHKLLPYLMWNVQYRVYSISESLAFFYDIMCFKKFVRTLETERRRWETRVLCCQFVTLTTHWVHYAECDTQTENMVVAYAPFIDRSINVYCLHLQPIIKLKKPENRQAQSANGWRQAQSANVWPPASSCARLC